MYIHKNRSPTNLQLLPIYISNCRTQESDSDRNITQTVHESTGFSPYHLVFGRSPKLPLDTILGRVTDNENAISLPEYAQDLHRSLEESAHENLALSH